MTSRNAAADDVIGHAEIVKRVDGSRGVLGVDRGQDEPARQRRTRRHHRGIRVPDLADEDQIGVHAEDRPQPLVHRQAVLLIDLDLLDVGKPEFDRVFDGVGRRGAQVHQRGQAVHRGRLARAGGAGDQDQAVEPADSRGDLLLIDQRESEVGDVPLIPRHAQQPQVRGLAVPHRSQRDADLPSHIAIRPDELAFHRLERAHEVQARGALQLVQQLAAFRRRQHFLGMNDPIHAVQHAEPLGHAVQVHVGGSLDDGVPDARSQRIGVGCDDAFAESG